MWDKLKEIIEWEGLNKTIVLDRNIKINDIPYDSGTIEIERDNQYRIKACIKSYTPHKFYEITDRWKVKVGEEEKPLTICGECGFKYNLKHCYIGSISSRLKGNSGDEHIFKSEIELLTHEIERIKSNLETKTDFLTEWYINGPSFHFKRKTKRIYNEKYNRIRNGSKSS